MAATMDIANRLVSISLFNKGQASRIFDRLRTQTEIVVLKNNQPAAYILSPTEHERITEMEENFYLLQEAYERLQANDGKPGLSLEQVMSKYDISQSELDQVEDVEFE